MKYKGQLRGKFCKAIGFNGCLLIVFLLIVGISVAIQYNHEDTVVATVQSITTQQNVSGGGKSGDVSTSYTYLVGTDKGTMQIEPSGIMSSTVFGTLKEGKTYRLHTRGYSFPLFGLYPFIVDAKEDSE